MSSPVMNTTQMGAQAVSLPRFPDRLSIQPAARLLAVASIAPLAAHFWATALHSGLAMARLPVVASFGEEHGVPGRRPLAFEANRGQADEQVKFLARPALCSARRRS